MGNLYLVLGDRKIHTNKTNRATTLVLPILWITHHKIKDGDSVSVRMDEDGNLVIVPHGK